MPFLKGFDEREGGMLGKYVACSSSPCPLSSTDLENTQTC